MKETLARLTTLTIPPSRRALGTSCSLARTTLVGWESQEIYRRIAMFLTGHFGDNGLSSFRQCDHK